jgi:leucyl aminopeptidase
MIPNRCIMKLYHSSFPKLSVSALVLDRLASVSTAFVPSFLGRSTFVHSFRIHDQQQQQQAAPSYTTTSTSMAESKMDQSFPTWSFDKPCKKMEWTDLVDIPLTIGLVDDGIEEADLIIVGIMSPAPKEEEDEEEDDNKKEKDVEPMDLVGAAKTIDDNLQGALSELLVENSKTFKNGAKIGSTTPTLRVVGGKSKRYIVMGLGPETTKEGEITDWTASGFKIGKTIATTLNAEKKVTSVHIMLPEVIASNGTIVKDLATAFYENLYTDNRYRTGANIKKAVEDLQYVKIGVDGSSFAEQSAIEAGKAIASGVFLAKDIVNAPHNVLNSESLAETAKRLAKESKGRLKCTVLDKKECEKRGMGSFLGVARGSETEPQFIHLTYTPPSGSFKKKIAVIGKGLLFDTGGYNIKTSMMELMKFDCGGSAAVIGAARVVAQLAPEDVEVHFIVAACENMINGKAMVPSDILTASNGKTIEVMNTDAEGRLTLADALVFADKELNCEEIVELSTLTGACMVALGKKICGLWTSNDTLATELEHVSKVTGDKSWRMPLASEYREQLDSTFADIKNVGTRYGGAVTAALFLQEFVNKKKPFAHIDIAGPVWDDKTGATGFGVKLVTEWINGKSSK